MNRPNPRPGPKSDLPRRLGMYALGLAIGLVLVGVLLQARAGLLSRSQPAQQGGTPAPE